MCFVVSDECGHQFVLLLLGQIVTVLVKLQGLDYQRLCAVAHPVTSQRFIDWRITLSEEDMIESGIEVRCRVDQRAVKVEQISLVGFQASANASRIALMVAW